MIKFVWAGLIVIGIVVAILTGRADILSETILNSAQDAASFSLSLLGIYCLLLGLLSSARASGLIESISRKAGGALSLLFRGIRRNGAAMGYITMNMVANMLGMGNAATPFGLKAMAALKEENGGKAEASDDMCTFIILNTASVQLLPLTVIGLRAAAGSSDPTSIVLTSFLATLATAVFGVAGGKLCAGLARRS